MEGESESDFKVNFGDNSDDLKNVKNANIPMIQTYFYWYCRKGLRETVRLSIRGSSSKWSAKQSSLKKPKKKRRLSL